jgi:transcriptional regulator with XRE-family HTH domain
MLNGPLIKKLRAAKDFTQEKLAAEAKVSRPTVIKAEQGENIDFTSLGKLAHVLGVSPGELLMDTALNVPL